MPQAVNIMAEVVAAQARASGAKIAPGDEKKFLEKQMKAGQVDPIKVLPLFFARLKELANPFLDDFYKSLERSRGRVAKTSEDWMKKFLGGGATTGITSFFGAWNQVLEDSIPNAERLGEIFKGVVHYFNAALLAPGETMAWLKGKEGEGNFLSAMFGKSSESEFVASIQKTFSQVQTAITASMEASRQSVVELKSEFSLLDDILAPMIRDLGNMMELSSAYQTGGVSGLLEKNLELNSRGDARRQAEAEAEAVFNSTGVRVPLPQRRAREDEIFLENESKRKSPEQANGYWQRLQKGSQQIDSNPFNPDNWGGALWDWGKSKLNNSFPSMPKTLLPQGGWLPLNTENPMGSSFPSNRGSNPFPSNTPSQQIPGMSGGILTITHHIKQDPLTVNATVEATTDADAIVQEIERRTEAASQQVWGSLLSSFPVVTQ